MQFGTKIVLFDAQILFSLLFEHRKVSDVIFLFIVCRRHNKSQGICRKITHLTPYHLRNIYTFIRTIQMVNCFLVSIIQHHIKTPAQSNDELFSISKRMTASSRIFGNIINPKCATYLKRNIFLTVLSQKDFLFYRQF